jgi:hypothetical protein
MIMEKQMECRLARETEVLLILGEKKYRYSFIHSSMALQPFSWTLASSSVSLSFNTDGRTPWTSDQPVAKPLPTQDNTNT